MTDPLPDGLTPADLEQTNLYDLARSNPEKAMIYADHMMKYSVSTAREHFVNQAKVVYFVDETELWRYHPAGFATLAEWCQQPEIDIPPSVLSDMKAIMKIAPSMLEQTGVDLLDLVRQVGHSKVRAIVPSLRKAYRDGTLVDQGPALVDIVHSNSCKEIMQMVVKTANQRLTFDFPATYVENASGTFTVIFRDLDFDELEALALKLNVRRWFDSQGRRIDPPLLSEPALPSGLD